MYYWSKPSVGSCEYARRGIVNQPDAQGLIWEHARRGLCISAPREPIGRFSSTKSRSPRRALALGPRRGAVGKKRTNFAQKKNCGYFVQMSFRLDHPFLQFLEGPASSIEYGSRRDALIGRRVLEATIIDRDILRDAGLWGEIEPFLHRTWVDVMHHSPARAGIGSWLVRTILSILSFFWSSFPLSATHQARRSLDPGWYGSDWGSTEGVESPGVWETHRHLQRGRPSAPPLRTVLWRVYPGAAREGCQHRGLGTVVQRLLRGGDIQGEPSP
ncbi:hypothetical protein L1887_32135 [Cichorium endivia]|nr:hypothetical protein L1887_32135 [Cichorium endivia]